MYIFLNYIYKTIFVTNYYLHYVIRCLYKMKRKFGLQRTSKVPLLSQMKVFSLFNNSQFGNLAFYIYIFKLYHGILCRRSSQFRSMVAPSNLKIERKYKMIFLFNSSNYLHCVRAIVSTRKELRWNFDGSLSFIGNLWQYPRRYEVQANSIKNPQESIDELPEPLDMECCPFILDSTDRLNFFS